jgi:hypothetical protein
MNPTQPTRRYTVIVLIVLVASALALFSQALFLGETFGERDLYGYYYAAKWLIAPLARISLDIPLWNPMFASGQPFAANPENELFHPLTSLFFLLPFEWAFRLQVILPPLFAVPCMFWFLRVLRRSRPAALLGAIAWGLGGFLLSTTNVLPFLFASAPLPLTLGFAVQVVRAPSRVNLVGFCLSFALQCLPGEPTSVLATLILLATVVLSQPRRRGTKAWSLLGAGACLGLLVAAVVLLPGAHHAGKTIRAAGLTDSMANEWAMPPVRALELIAPYILGHVDRSQPARFGGAAFYGAKVFPYYYSLYPGLLVGMLALLAWTRRIGRGFSLWAACALVGYAISLGDHFVLWPLLRHVPGLSGLRYPEKGAVLVMMSTVVAASHGFDWYVLGGLRRRRVLTVGLVTVAGAGVVVAAIAILRGQSQIMASDAVRDALRATIVASVIIAALIVSRRWRRARAGLLLCAVLLLDLLAVGRSLVPTVPVARLAMPPQFLAPLLSSERDDLIFHLADWNPSFSDVGGLAKPPAPARWGLAMTLERDFDFTQLRWTYDATHAWLEVVQASPQLMEPLLARRGVTAVVTFAPGTHWEDNRLVGPNGGPAVQTLVARHANAFAFAASRVERVHGVAGWKAKVRELGQEAANAVCVEDDQMEPFAGTPSPAQIVIARKSPMAFDLEVSADGPGPAFVAINQTWDTGWQARLDGRPTPVIRTDLALSGVLVPPGKHTIALSYDDPWLRAGLWLSVVGCLGCLVLVLWGRLTGAFRRAAAAPSTQPTPG